MAGRGLVELRELTVLVVDAGAAIHGDGHGSVVEQGDLHIGPKDTGLYPLGPRLAAGGEEFPVQGFGYRRSSRLAVSRAVAFGGIRHEGELGNHQAFALDILHRKVHSTLLIPKNAKPKHLPNQVLDILAGILRTDAYQGQKARANGGMDSSVDADLCVAHPL